MLTLSLLAVAHANIADDFVQFMKAHNKVYETEDLETRFRIFQSNVEIMNKHNAAGHSWTMGVNQFSDLTPDEFEQTMLTLIPRGDGFAMEVADLSGLPTADSIDWVAKGAVTPIKDQGQCGSCWAFSTTGSTEGAHFLASGKLVSLSEKQLVDCSKLNLGCNGGEMDRAFNYLQSNGAILEAEYPYEPVAGKCLAAGKTVAVHVKSHKDVDHNEASLQTAVTQQPISIAVDARAWQNYASGIFDGCAKLHQLDHGVLAVGFDTAAGYWKVKNSWGPSWGESGYIRLKAGGNECGLTNQPSWPTTD